MHFQNAIPYSSQATPVLQTPMSHSSSRVQYPTTPQSTIRRITIDGRLVAQQQLSSPEQIPSIYSTPIPNIYSNPRIVSLYSSNPAEQLVQQSTGSTPAKVSYRKYYEPSSMQKDRPSSQIQSVRHSEQQTVSQMTSYLPTETIIRAEQPRVIVQRIPQGGSLYDSQLQNSLAFERSKSNVVLSTQQAKTVPQGNSFVKQGQTESINFSKVFTNLDNGANLTAKESLPRSDQSQPTELLNIADKVSRMEGELTDLKSRNQQLLTLVSLQNNYEQIRAQKGTDEIAKIPEPQAPVQTSQPSALEAELQLQVGKQTAEIAALKKALEKSKTKTKQLKPKLKEIEALRAELHTLPALQLKLKELEACKKSLMGENDELRRQAAAAAEDGQVLQRELARLDAVLQSQPSAEEVTNLQSTVDQLQQRNIELYEAYMNELREKEQATRLRAQENLSQRDEHRQAFSSLETAYKALQGKNEAMAASFERKEAELESAVTTLEERLEKAGLELERLLIERNELLEKLQRKEQGSENSSKGEEIVVINEIEHLDEGRSDENKVSKMISKGINMDNSGDFEREKDENLEAELERMGEEAERQGMKVGKLKAERFELTMRLLFALSEIERLQSERPYRG